MNTQQDKTAQMQSKLREGLQILSEASDDDSYILGIALIKIHGALEDFFRLEIARRAPSLRMEVEDASKTTWKDLIKYGKQYLRLTEQDIQVINEANIQRQRVAHGGNYEKGLNHLMGYADFVERWCGKEKPRPSEIGRRPATILRKPYQPPPPPTLVTTRPAPKDWYRSAPFFWLVFFLVPPLWAALILTDRRQGCLVQALAGTMFLLELAAVMVLVNPSLLVLPDPVQFFERQFHVPVPFLHGTSTPEAALSQDASPAAGATVPVAATGAGCHLIWTEYAADDLAGLNRALAWEKVVMKRVEDSGMTPRQFYDEVVVRNPELERDGYEFKKGKIYLLPECE